jgi:hypothetical protein
MGDLLNEAVRASLRMDWLDAFDAVEDLHRNLDRKSANRLGLSDEQYEVVAGSAKAAYNALFAGRVVLDGNA